MPILDSVCWLKEGELRIKFIKLCFGLISDLVCRLKKGKIENQIYQKCVKTESEFHGGGKTLYGCSPAAVASEKGPQP